MRRAVLLVSLALLVPSLAAAVDRISVTRILTDDQASAAVSAAGSLVEQVAALAGRLFPSSISIDTSGDGKASAAYGLSVYAATKADAPVISLTLTSTADEDRSAAYTFYGLAAPDTPAVLARGLFLLWANLSGTLDRTTAAPPVVVEELPTDLVGPNTYPMGLAVTPQGTVVAALGLACVELDQGLGLVRRIGTGLYDSGLYALAYGVSATPAGTVYMKPGTGRDIYKLAPGAADPQRVPLGVDMTTTSVTALPDGSLFLLDAVKKTAVRLQGRQRQDIKVFTSPYTYISAAAAAPDGSLWVFDTLMKGIRIFTTEGTPIDSLLPLVDINTPLNPTSLSVGPDGDFVVFSYGQLARFRRDGSLAWRITALKGADDESLPTSGTVAVDWKGGLIYLGDATGKRIVKLLDVAWCAEKGIVDGQDQALLSLRARRTSDELGSYADTAGLYESRGNRLMARAYWQKLLDADPGNDDASRRIAAMDIDELRDAARDLDARARATLAAIGLETARPLSVQAIQKYELVLSKAPGDDATRAAMAALQQLFNGAGATPSPRKPLTIVDARVAALFPSLMQWYAAHPAGNVTVKNPLPDKVQNVRVSFFIPRFMDLPAEAKPVASLAPGESVVVPVSPAFNQGVLELQEDMQVQAQITVAYGTDADQAASRTMTVTIHRNSALTWDDTRKISSFITPNEATVSGFAARTLAAATPANQGQLSGKVFQAMRIVDALGTYGIAYVQDPDTPVTQSLGKAEIVDTVRFPRVTLFNRTGDCDDTTALLCSLLESAGIRTAVLTTPGHIFMAFDSGEPSQNAFSLTAGGLEVIAHEGSAWIPVETTILSQGFMAAWRSASELVRKYARAGPFEMIPLAETRDSYPALPLPPSSVSLVDPSRASVDAAFAASFSGFTATLYTARVKELDASIAGLAGRQAVRARIQEGVLHALFGKLSDAEAAFRAALKDDPTLVSSYVNLANVRLLSKDPDGALSVVKAGLKQNSDSALLNLLAARIYVDKGDVGSAAVAFAAVKKAAPDLAAQYPEIASAAAGGGGTARAGKAGQEAPVIWGSDP